MARRTPKRELKRMKEGSVRGRSATYRYIRDNFERFVEIGVGAQDGPSWEAFAALLAREKQKNTRGEQITRDTARRVFERVKRDLQEKAIEQRTGVPQRKRQPSQLPANWQPAPAGVQHAPTATRAGGSLTPSTQRPVEVRKRTPEERLAAIRAELDARSGR